MARKRGGNPDVPLWFADAYFQAIQQLAETGAAEVMRAESEEDARAILGLIAIAKRLRIHGCILVKYSEDELSDNSTVLDCS